MPTTIKLVLTVRFFQTTAGAEPVRDWLRELDAVDRKLIGEDVKTVQIGWPLGMPLVRKMARICGRFASACHGESLESCSRLSAAK